MKQYIGNEYYKYLIGDREILIQKEDLKNLKKSYKVFNCQVFRKEYSPLLFEYKGNDIFSFTLKDNSVIDISKEDYKLIIWNEERLKKRKKERKIFQTNSLFSKTKE